LSLGLDHTLGKHLGVAVPSTVICQLSNICFLLPTLIEMVWTCPMETFKDTSA
jgi:hypothetical protein